LIRNELFFQGLAFLGGGVTGVPKTLNFKKTDVNTHGQRNSRESVVGVGRAPRDDEFGISAQRSSMVIVLQGL
jgi:hypothetical protein